MKFIEDIIANIWVQRAFWSLIVILFSFLIYHIAARFLNNKEQKNSKILSSKKNKTFIRMLKSIIVHIKLLLYLNLIFAEKVK